MQQLDCVHLITKLMRINGPNKRNPLRKLDYAHLVKAMDSVKELSQYSFSVQGDSRYRRRHTYVDTELGPGNRLGPVNLWRRDLLNLYTMLLATIDLATPYERVCDDLLTEIDVKAVALMKYAPADKWNGRFSATSAAVDALICFRRMFASEVCILDDLRRKQDVLSKMRIDWLNTGSDIEREIESFFQCAPGYDPDSFNCREAMTDSLEGLDRRINLAMRSWFPDSLFLAVRLEARLFGDVVIDPADKNDSPERAAPEEWEFASTFLVAAMELGAHEKPVCSERMWEKAGFTIGDQKDVDTGSADLNHQQARDICRWLASGAKGRKLELQVGLGFIEPQGRRGYVLTPKGLLKAQAIERGSTAT